VTVATVATVAGGYLPLAIAVFAFGVAALCTAITQRFARMTREWVKDERVKYADHIWLLEDLIEEADALLYLGTSAPRPRVDVWRRQAKTIIDARVR
jgi:hypothetical protein